jgi:predicted O-linked N-acetylglucosamine transferase (SPINDLY family)
MPSIDQLIRSAMADQQAGRLAQAEATYRQVLSLQPRNHHALHFLGITLSQMGQCDAAIELIKRSLMIHPNQPAAWSNLGLIYPKLNRYNDAVDACRRAIALHPRYAYAYHNLGHLLASKGQLDEAIAAFRQALRHQPNYPSAHSNILFTLHFLPGQSPQMILEEARRWDEHYGVPLSRLARPHIPDLTPDRPLRIGYVSPDFRDHVVGRNLLPLLTRHDHSQFHITCYSGVTNPDAITERYQKCVDAWRSTLGISDPQLADLIRGDGIDILVELSLHMSNNRLLTFAMKPAPIQVTFAGYPGTTGLSAIDYRLTDPYLDPPEHDSFYSEKSIRLPDSFWCYDPIDVSLEVNSLPADSVDHITFGCLSNFCKINNDVLALWSRVLGQVPASRIIILAPPGDHRQRIIGQFAIDPDRVEFVEYRPHPAYLEMYHRIDISLDTFPYNGHTTSLDSLWMGVPVVSLTGPGAPCRAGLSQLTNLALTELVAESPDQFIRIATELAADLPKLKRLRASLRQRMQQSPLMDAAGFAHGIEAAYRQIWTAVELKNARSDR